MATFHYRARDNRGQLVEGHMTVDSEAILGQKLAEQGMLLVEARTASGEGGGRQFSLARIKRRDLILFTNHLATSVEAGVSVVMAMSDYAAEIDHPRFRRVIEDVARQVLAGTTFSQALATHPKVFNEMYSSIVATGEATGNLDRVLKDLVGFLEWQEELAGQIKQATIYPAFLVAMIVGVMVVMMAFTVPRFIPIMESFNVALPAPTRILIAISKFFQHSWWVLVLVAAASFVTYKATVRLPAGRLFWDRVKLKLPLFGALNLKIVLSKFAHYLSIMFGSGISILESFVIIQRVVGSEVIRLSIGRVRDGVEKGRSVYEALKDERIFPPLILRMIQVGESTGKLDVSLDKVSEYYDKEVPATIKKIFSAFEPMLVLVMGGAVLFIALSIFLPIYKLTSTIGGQR